MLSSLEDLCDLIPEVLWMMDGSMCQVTGDEEDENMVEEEAENGFK